MKKAICIGINNYPGSANDLNGCVNDANDWSALLQGFGFSTTVMLDAQATRANVKAALDGLVTSAAPGDVVVFTYSGHGTQSLDTSGDEGDLYDEALYVYDGKIIDDELRTIINQINPKATLVVISDSCFSGSVTRLVPENTKPRFMPPSEPIPANAVANKRLLLPESDMPEILISGCSDSEYSYDAEFNGRPNGAMTALAISVIKQNPKITYNAFYANLRLLLPSKDYPQTPQLEGAATHKDTLLFEPFEVAIEPPPSSDSQGCLAGLTQKIRHFFNS